MNTVPMHPAVVHAPLALAVALPVVALVVALALFRGRGGRGSWTGVVGLQGLLCLAVWGAIETGESEEHRVERVTGEAPVEAHEHHAETLLKASVANLAVGAVAAAMPVAALPAAAAVSALGSAGVLRLTVARRAGGRGDPGHRSSVSANTRT